MAAGASAARCPKRKIAGGPGPTESTCNRSAPANAGCGSGHRPRPEGAPGGGLGRVVLLAGDVVSQAGDGEAEEHHHDDECEGVKHKHTWSFAEENSSREEGGDLDN